MVTLDEAAAILMLLLETGESPSSVKAYGHDLLFRMQMDQQMREDQEGP